MNIVEEGTEAKKEPGDGEDAVTCYLLELRTVHKRPAQDQASQHSNTLWKKLRRLHPLLKSSWLVMAAR